MQVADERSGQKEASSCLFDFPFVLDVESDQSRVEKVVFGVFYGTLLASAGGICVCLWAEERATCCLGTRVEADEARERT